MTGTGQPDTEDRQPTASRRRRITQVLAALLAGALGVLIPLLAFHGPGDATAANVIRVPFPTGTGIVIGSPTTGSTTTGSTTTGSTTTGSTTTGSTTTGSGTTATQTTTTGTTTTTATTTTTTSANNPPLLAPAPGQPDPPSVWDSKPIPAVVAAVKAAQAKEPLPSSFNPPLADLQTDSYATPPGCQPTFGTGVIPPEICRLGDAGSDRIIATLGDSHSGMWNPAVIADAAAQHDTMIPLAKSGCQLSIYNVNSSGWPCGSWYKWALAEDKKLHPVATLVSFLYKTGWESAPAKYVDKLKTILSQVVNPILIVDMPYQNELPAVCLTTAGANRGTCSSKVPSTYVPFVKAVARMAAANHIPVIPTMQWFCADGTCPMIIANTITTRDKDHMTEEYVDELTKVFSYALNPILRRYLTTGTGVAGTTTTGSR